MVWSLQNLAPIYEELSTDVEGVEIAEVDCTVYQDICRDQGIRGYPTVKLFKANKEGIVIQVLVQFQLSRKWLTNNIKLNT
eukprot:gnl/Chilomastix_caulleri/6445.p1 GENE.gnl/Chilomastix_caulleri/6445~~gnl/Chilomastix_caulleri/6445.p1  ORF type:complete len:81 (+),score=17.46 gnl/Chilomastix_caulleri/6445:159-401(+)